MLVRSFVGTLVGLAVLFGASVASAEDKTTEQTTEKTVGKAERPKSFFDRIDNFGRSVIGGILPLEKTKAKQPAPTMPSRTAVPKSYPLNAEPADESPSVPRAGSVPRGEVTRPSVVARAVRDPVEPPTDDIPTLVARQDNVRMPTMRDRPADEPLPESPAAPIVSKPVPRPLHERLARFQRSPFGATGATEVTEEAPPEPENTPPVPKTSPAEKTPSAEKIAPIPTPTPKPIPATDAPAVIEEASAAVDRPIPVPEKPENRMLFARKGPALSVETLGPRTIAVGKEATYEVHLVNSGEVAAENLTVHVSLPEWTEVAGTQASVGTAATVTTNSADKALQWKIGTLGAKDRERLTVRLIPRQSRPFDLAVRWDYKPVASQASIEVQEPKLSLRLEGPREVLYGKRELYRLKVVNTGTGPVENVVITLVPMGTGENVPATHKLSVLGAGEEKTLDVELTARQAGNLIIQADAKGDGGIRAELAEKVVVRRAALNVAITGPKSQFLGTTGVFAIVIRNPGTAPAHNVNLSIALPAGAKYLSGPEHARVDAAGSKLQWTIDALTPGAEQSCLLKCRLSAPGTNRIRLVAAADAELAASAEAVVEVQGVADLTMNVKDPSGPVPVGEDTVYEVLIRNRGTKEARGVEVFGYFSRGIEPTETEGAPGRLGPGQVVFQPIASLGPGEEMVLKIHARAQVAGNHVFRAEAHCKPLSARLVSEATNLYYGEGVAAAPAEKSPPHEAMRPVPGSAPSAK